MCSDIKVSVEWSEFEFLSLSFFRQICHKDVHTKLPRNGLSDQTPGHIPEDKKKSGFKRTQSTFDPFENPLIKWERVHSENNACINFNKSSSAGKVSQSSTALQPQLGECGLLTLVRAEQVGQCAGSQQVALSAPYYAFSP